MLGSARNRAFHFRTLRGVQLTSRAITTVARPRRANSAIRARCTVECGARRRRDSPLSSRRSRRPSFSFSGAGPRATPDQIVLGTGVFKLGSDFGAGELATERLPDAGRGVTVQRVGFLDHFDYLGF